MYLECRHIFTGGAKCQSPALTGHEFCYFHDRKRNRQTPSRRSGEPSTLVHNLPQLEDADAIQLALSDVVLALAANRIDPRRAQILIYGLQVASQNAKRTSVSRTLDPVRDAFEGTDGELIGPRWQSYETKDMDLDDDEDDEEDDEEDDNKERPALTRLLMTDKPSPEAQPVSGTVEDMQGKAECNRTPPASSRPKQSATPRLGSKNRSKTIHKPCRSFPRSADAPLHPPEPSVPSSEFRRLARQQILAITQSGVMPEPPVHATLHTPVSS